MHCSHTKTPTSVSWNAVLQLSGWGALWRMRFHPRAALSGVSLVSCGAALFGGVRSGTGCEGASRSSGTCTCSKEITTLEASNHWHGHKSEAQWLHGCCLNLRPRNWLHNLLVLRHRWLRRRFQSLTQTEITMKTTQVLKLSGYTAAVILRPRNWLHNLLVLRHRWLRRRFQSLTQTEITMKTTQVLKLSGYTAAVWSCGPGTGCTTCWSCVTGGSGGGSKAWHRQKSPWKRHKFWSSVVTRLLSDPAAQELAAQLAGLASQVAQVAVPKPDTDRNHHENDTSSEANWLHGCCLILRPRNWLHNLLVLLHRWLRRRFQSLTQTEITMKTTQVLKLSGYTAAVWSCGPGTGCTTCWSCFTGGSGGGSKAWHRQKSPWKRHKFWS